MRHKLSGLCAACTSVPILFDSTLSKYEMLFNRPIIELTDLFTKVMIFSMFTSVDGPSGMISPFASNCGFSSFKRFLCMAIISSRKTARNMVGSYLKKKENQILNFFRCCLLWVEVVENELHTLKLGCTKQRAVAMADAVNGPVVPMFDKYSTMFGVKRNGTARLASNSPFVSSTSNLKYEMLTSPESWWMYIMSAFKRVKCNAYSHKHANDNCSVNCEWIQLQKTDYYSLIVWRKSDKCVFELTIFLNCQ